MKIYVFHQAQWCRGDLSACQGDVFIFLHRHFGTTRIVGNVDDEKIVLLPYDMMSSTDPVVLTTAETPPGFRSLFTNQAGEQAQLTKMWTKIKETKCMDLREPCWKSMEYHPEAPWMSYQQNLDHCLVTSCRRAVRSVSSSARRDANMVMNAAKVSCDDLKNIIATVNRSQ